MSDPVIIRFWGVRGSVPTPMTQVQSEEKIRIIARAAAHELIREITDNMKNTDWEPSVQNLDDFITRAIRQQPPVYGGNTSCVEVRYGDQIFVLDMGTGLRPFGNSLFPEMFKNSGLNITFFLSHVHWDHMQGLPFFGPLYVNKATGINNHFHVYGGTDWQKTAEIVLHGQMDPPTFPVSFREIMKITNVDFGDMYDMHTLELGKVKIKFRKLNHPQETYGVRMQFPDGQVVVYSTDNEPFDPAVPDPRLLNLADNADVWIQDCQYTKPQYDGIEGGVPRHGWGHSYPQSVAKTAALAKVKKVILFHHDPGSSDARIKQIELQTQELIHGHSNLAKVIAAHEGLELKL